MQDPIAAYKSKNLIEANLVSDLLNDAGVEAHVVNDASQVGEWLGIMSEIHEPEIWIDRSDLERAQPVLANYRQQSAERRRAPAEGDPIVVICEECGSAAMFSAGEIGSVQLCPNCQANVDVLDEIPWAETPPDGEVDE